MGRGVGGTFFGVLCSRFSFLCHHSFHLFPGRFHCDIQENERERQGRNDKDMQIKRDCYMHSMAEKCVGRYEE